MQMDPAQYMAAVMLWVGYYATVYWPVSLGLLVLAFIWLLRKISN